VEYFCQYLSICYLGSATPRTETRTPAKRVSLTSTRLRRDAVMAARGERFDLRPNERCS
jgi:hypothetical protein